MPTLIDAPGDAWRLDLSAVPAARVVRFRRAVGDRAGSGLVDWYRLGARMAGSPARLGRGLRILLEPQAEARGRDAGAVAARFCDGAVIRTLPAVWAAAVRGLRAEIAGGN